MEEPEISEIAIRLQGFRQAPQTYSQTGPDALSAGVNKQGKPIFEVHTWEKLSPFYNIARMIDVMTFFIKIMLIAIVLISIMNVMIMAVYERIREIGTIAAIGTLPGKILSMFVIEGFCLGVLGAVIGNVVGLAIVFILRLCPRSPSTSASRQGLSCRRRCNAPDICSWYRSSSLSSRSSAASSPPSRRRGWSRSQALRHV